MNFFKELKKKSDSAYSKYEKCYGMEVVELEDVKRVWRVFWNKRKKELEELIQEEINSVDVDGFNKDYSRGAMDVAKNELSWIEKQLKEVK